MDHMKYTPNLKFLVETLMEEQPTPLSKEEKAEFVTQMKNFSEMGEFVYGRTDLELLSDRVREMIRRGEQIAMEKGDWFDNVTVKRHMKDLQNAYKTFEATAKEVNQLNHRLAASYEDIAQLLNKYFEVG
jgi:uncharacterized protein YwgA